MCDALSFVEIDRQYVELLPARTVLSMVCFAPNDGATPTSGTAGTGDSTAGAATASGPAGAGSSTPTITGNAIFVYVAGNQYNTLTGGAGGPAGTGTSGVASTGGTATGCAG
jgi:hypothetical protein